MGAAVLQLVTKLRMRERATGVVSWRLRAKLGFVPLDVDFESEFTLDLITGSVLQHKDSWDLHRYFSLPLSSSSACLHIICLWSAGLL